MWLKFGVSKDNALVNIEDVSSGKTDLTCLYCGGGLTAKKDTIKEHHFAHLEQVELDIWQGKSELPANHPARLS